ncbi:hypothetical protein AB0J14_30000 [Micromonospora arborensis]|uniref:hypothetical protein n=1 Tax=Micromonospora arborensis TaxID=2116518 RepID=UPI0033F09772
MCSPDKTDYGAVACQQLAGGCVDAHVGQLLLAVFAPAALEVSLAVGEQITARRAQVERIWRRRLERADYTVDRARRQYQLAKPENRLVVRQLERDWEQTMAERQRLGEEDDRSSPRRAPPRRLLSDADSKQLVRCLIERVKLTVLGDSERVHIRITWAGGHRTDTELTRPVAQLTQLNCYPQLTDRIRQLASTGNSPDQIAEQLNANGLRPPKRRERFGPQGVRDLMHDLGVATPGHPGHARGPRYHQTNGGATIHLAQHLSMPDVALGWLMQHRRLVRDYEAGRTTAPA